MSSMIVDTKEAKPIVWSPQQMAFINWAKYEVGSCVLEAVAGAGKTTTLLEAAREMPGQVAICAYNKKISDEIKGKLVKMNISWEKVQAGTVHSFGFAAYRKSFKNVRVDEYKVTNLVETMFPNENEKYFIPIVSKLISLAKQRAIGVMGAIQDESLWYDIIDHFDLLDSDRPIDASRVVASAQDGLERSNALTSIIDFDDMVYLPVLLKCRFWQFDVVMVDEAQDTNPARRALVRAMLKKGGRCIAVGDRHQAIYGFTGADNDSLDLIKKDFDCIDLPLTTTYRCPKAVVAFAQQWVSHINAHESAPEGQITECKAEDFFKRNDLNGESAVLCRLTKPLISMAFALIKKKIACRVEGRDIAANLKKLATRWKISDVDSLEEKLETYLANETTKLLAKKQEMKLQVLEDTVDCIRIIISQCRSEGKELVSDVIAYIDELFADNVTGILVLSTIHKSKGREWENVFWLDRHNTCPSKWARQQWQKDQEVNLMYVAATRAKSNLIDLSHQEKKAA